MEEFSFSRLSRYQDCPGGFYRYYCMKVAEPPSLPLVSGKGAHSVIESAMRLGIKDELFFKVMSKTVADNAPLRLDPEEIFSLTYQEMVFKEFHPDNIIEQHIKLPLMPDNPMSPIIQMHIDVNRHEKSFIKLIDWKTNRKSYHPAETRQLPLYAWALNQIHRIPVRGKLAFLRTRKCPEHEFSAAEMEEARRWAIDLALDIQDRLYRVQRGVDSRELFKITPGGACRYCGYAFECNDGELPVPGEIKTYEEAQSLGSDIIRLESTLEQMKQLLKGYVEFCGPVNVPGDRQFILQQSSYWKWTPAAIQAAHERMKLENQNPFEYLGITATQIKRLGWGSSLVKNLGAKKVFKAPLLKHTSSTPQEEKAVASSS